MCLNVIQGILASTGTEIQMFIDHYNTDKAISKTYLLDISMFCLNKIALNPLTYNSRSNVIQIQVIFVNSPEIPPNIKINHQFRFN